MRGNWDTAEPLVHAPNQQRQQQQQTIAEEQRHPLHSPTTPAWGIADRIVKDEHAEDKNNDSGVSPDHYTSNSGSPTSRRSSSTANCSLSPGSATSQDSQTNMQCSTFDYSPQRMYSKGCGSPVEYARHPSMDDHRGGTDQPMDVVSSTLKPAGMEDIELGQDTLQCPICAFATVNRLTFTEHLMTHCTTKCDTADFVKTVLGQLTTSAPSGTSAAAPATTAATTTMTMTMAADENGSSPTQGERSEHESEEADEPGVRVPRVNSQGKVKTFRCKQCNFVAITKLEFWEHSRGHIKAEKLLTCPKCPFVTEYKHHLEYHLRNHFGSKPFKCDKCSYSCVNKSMLNSHLKSHSNVYQYRCANCSYATKYCHSLKLHLRKYSHQPAMVLNADGSPNPLPIIDVYGTRRGPKQKPLKSDDETSAPQTNNNNNNNNSSSHSQMPLSSPQHVHPSQISPVGHRLAPMNPVAGMLGCASAAIPGAATPFNHPGNEPAPDRSPIPFPYNPIFGGFAAVPQFPFAEDSLGGEKQHHRHRHHQEPAKSTALMDYLKAMDAEKMSVDMPRDLATRGFPGNGSPGGMWNGLSSSENDVVPKANEVVPSIAATESQDRCATDPRMTVAPLDLSKPEPTGTVPRPGRPITNSPRATGTSRRKGRAVKLERRVVEEDTDEEQMQLHQQQLQLQQQHERMIATSEEQEENFEPPAASSPGSSDGKEGGEGKASSVSNEFICQYCEIAFGNVVMYTVHMGYHGYKDPYTCNMCGHQSTDKVSFFLHIARSKHS